MAKREWVFRLHWSDEDLPQRMGMEALPLRTAHWQGMEFRIVYLSFYLGAGRPEDPRESLWLEIWEGGELLERIGGREVYHLKSLAEEFVDRLLSPEAETRLPNLYTDPEVRHPIPTAISTAIPKASPKAISQTISTTQESIMFKSTLELAGIITQSLPLEQGTNKRTGDLWRKQSYIVQTESGNYPKSCCVAVWGDRIETLNLSAYLGQEVLLSVDVESREFNGRYYTEIRAIRLISTATQHQPATMPQQVGTATPPNQPVVSQNATDAVRTPPQPMDDLPF